MSLLQEIMHNKKEKGLTRLAALRLFLEHSKETVLMGGALTKVFATIKDGDNTLTVERMVPSGLVQLAESTEALLNSAVAGSPTYAAKETSLVKAESAES